MIDVEPVGRIGRAILPVTARKEVETTSKS